LGNLSTFYVEVSRFEIHPVVGWLSSKPEVKLSADEVEKVIYFPLKKFKPPYQNIHLQTVTGSLNVPCIKYQNEIIWGATAMILSEFSEILSKITHS
jgi:hypothetical protein